MPGLPGQKKKKKKTTAKKPKKTPQSQVKYSHGLTGGNVMSSGNPLCVL